MKKLPISLRRYILIIYLITITSFIFFLKMEYTTFLSVEFEKIIFFIFLTVLVESLTVSYKDMSFSTGFAITVASFILFGALNATIILVLGFVLRISKYDSKYKHIFNTPFYGTLYNLCGLVLPIIYGNYFYKLLGGVHYDFKLDSHAFPIIVFGIVFNIVNILIISMVSSIMNKKSIVYLFLNNFKLILLNAFALTPFGVLLAYVFNLYSYLGVILVLIPILLIRYTFSLHIQTKSQYLETVDALMHAMEARDKYTEGHSKRVAEIATGIAKQLKYNDWKIEKLNIAALLHDVGKVGIDDCILNKTGKLTKEEFDVIKNHPQIGYNILKDIKNLENILPIVRNHHERYDGCGYPDKKNDKALSLDVFIIQLADSIDAMSTNRPYKDAMKTDEVIAEVKKHSGSQFHPKVVEAYLKMIEKQKK